MQMKSHQYTRIKPSAAANAKGFWSEDQGEIGARGDCHWWQNPIGVGKAVVAWGAIAVAAAQGTRMPT
jgi:hypothetical protein